MLVLATPLYKSSISTSLQWPWRVFHNHKMKTQLQKVKKEKRKKKTTNIWNTPKCWIHDQTSAQFRFQLSIKKYFSLFAVVFLLCFLFAFLQLCFLICNCVLWFVVFYFWQLRFHSAIVIGMSGSPYQRLLC